MYTLPSSPKARRALFAVLATTALITSAILSAPTLAMMHA